MLAEFNPKSKLPDTFEYVDLESVVGTELVMHRTENRDSAPSRAQRLAQRGDIFYQTVRPYQKNNYLFDLPFSNYVFSTGYAQMRPKNSGYFLLTLLQEEKFVNKVLERSTGTSYPAINSNDLAKLSVNVPTNKIEEVRIGLFFKYLDNTLALHQRKLGQLKRLKQGFLQGLFANDTNVPKLRFAGFTEKWEQRKFNNCFNFPVSTNSLSRAMLNYDNGEIKNIHYGDILIKYSTILNVKEDEIPYITGGELEKYKSNLLENQDLIFADAAEDESVGKAVEVSGITNENLVSGLHTIVARVKGEKAPFFWGYYINSDIYHRQLLRLMQGSKVSAISKGNLQKTNVSFPNRMKEQQKIGTFFKQLDDTITLHQNKLSQLKKLKKALLQSMFI